MNNLTSYLFATNAIKICSENEPFWYTSGKIGPYFINTHFLFGSEDEANNLLNFIDIEKSDRINFPDKLFQKVLKQYITNDIYRSVLDSMVDFIKSRYNMSDFYYISGGERRDWFFSYMIAYLLRKPHISIFKDSSIILSNYRFTLNLALDSQIVKTKVLHISDLITEASSYVRTWIPSIERIGAKLCYSLSVIDRKQGGNELLQNRGIESFSLFSIDKNLFDQALSLGIINNSQYEMLIKYYNNPDITMKEFLSANPNFLQNALNSDEKIANRARLCIEKGFYR